jgi:hypothetical protein
VFAQLSKVHTSISFNKLDVDDLSEAAAENNISSVPTFQFWNGQKKVAEVRYYLSISILNAPCLLLSLTLRIFIF